MVQRHAVNAGRSARVVITALVLAATALPWALAQSGPTGPVHGHAHGHDADDDTLPEAADLPAAPGGLVRSLEDVTRRTRPGRIAWSTYWKLCWQPVPGAVYYEARLVTSEGASRTPRRLDKTCYRVEAAAGENPVAEGLPKRALMLAMQAAQSSVRVRAVFADGRTSAWTAEQPLGSGAEQPHAATPDTIASSRADRVQERPR